MTVWHLGKYTRVPFSLRRNEKMIILIWHIIILIFCWTHTDFSLHVGPFSVALPQVFGLLRINILSRATTEHELRGAPVYAPTLTCGHEVWAERMRMAMGRVSRGGAIWRGIIYNLAGEHLGIPQEELEDVTGEEAGAVWVPQQTSIMTGQSALFFWGLSLC